MKKISVWAKHNPVPARVIIFFIHVLLIFLAGYLGTQFHKIPEPVFYITTGFLLFFIIIYPHSSKKHIFRKRFYTVEKTCDFLVAASVFTLLVFFANHNLKLPSFRNSLYAVSLLSENEKPTPQQILEYLSTGIKAH